MNKGASTGESFSLKTAIRRKWQRLQRPGNHWFFLLYLGGITDDHGDRQFVEIRDENAVITGFFKQIAAVKTAAILDLDQGF